MNYRVFGAGGLLGLTLIGLLWALPVQPRPVVTPLPDDVTVEISSTHVTEWQHSTIYATLRFTNRTADSMWILKPVDGSDTGRRMPNYRFAVTGRHNERIPQQGVCGTIGFEPETGWPEEYLVEIPPGQSAEVGRQLLYQPRRHGRYTLAFQYVYQPGQSHWPVPPQAWIGTLTAKPVTVYCNPDPTIRRADSLETEYGK